MENSNSSRFEPLQHNGDVSSSDNGIAGGRTNDAFGVFDQSSLSRYFSTKPYKILISVCDAYENPENCLNPNCKFRVKKCGRCLICDNLNESHFVVSSVTGRVHHIPINEEVSCKASNLIYLLTCNSCKIQYTGETVQQLNERTQGHRGPLAV